MIDLICGKVIKLLNDDIIIVIRVKLLSHTKCLFRYRQQISIEERL